MSAVRGVGGREVPGADPVIDAAAEAARQKKRNSKRAGKKAKKKTKKKPAAPVQEQRAESTSGAEAGSESSLHMNGVGADDGSDGGFQENGGNEKITDDSSVEDDGDDTIVIKPRDDMADDMPISTKQLLDEPLPSETETIEKGPVELWLDSRTEHPYKGFSQDLRAKVIEFLTDSVGSDYDPIHMCEIRKTIWRAVVRSNYWWVNPDTGEWTGRQAPISVNDGVFAGNFEAFVQCCAERQDRVGRDIATHEYVRKVEADVRDFLHRADKAGLHEQLEHLAFLLMFDETKRHIHALELREMQERIALAFDVSAKMNWKGLTYMRTSGQKPKLNNNTHPGVGEIVWNDATFGLEEYL